MLDSEGRWNTGRKPRIGVSVRSLAFADVRQRQYARLRIDSKRFSARSADIL